MIKYDQLILYYFSGTGNAKNAAIWFTNIAKKKGIETFLINIDRFKKIEIPELNGKILIGFCTPTHGFNLPPLVLKFIRKFPKCNDSDVFLLNTRGGLKLSRLFIPGISGIAQLLPALLLWLKGFKIVGMQPLDLPSNWLILHPGLKKKVINSIYTRCNGIIDDFANSILAGRKRYKALLSFPIDILLLPVALGYYFIGRFFLAKTLIATDACNKCDICILKCPVEAIKKVKERPFWTYKCESCMRCVNSCPQRAIETAHGFSGLILVGVYVLILPFLISVLRNYDILDVKKQSYVFGQFWSIFTALVLLIFTFLSYGILHFLMRLKIANRIITYSSLSKYKFWRRFKSPKSKLI